jgi:S1-C subfamily serine protease
MRAVSLLCLLLFAACARLPAEEARHTPAAQVAATGFAALSHHGLPLGSAVAVAPDRLLTNAHAVPAGAERLRFTRGDGAGGGEAVVLARSAAMDLAVLGIAPGVMQPVSLAPAAPAVGQPLWAMGAPAAGAAVVAGVAEHPAIELAGHGPGFTARLGALMGYSGGPVVDAAGRVHGMVTALPRPGAAPILAALTGFDVDGLARGAAGREVFVLSLAAAQAEAARIAP